MLKLIVTNQSLLWPPLGNLLSTQKNCFCIHFHGRFLASVPKTEGALKSGVIYRKFASLKLSAFTCTASKARGFSTLTFLIT